MAHPVFDPRRPAWLLAAAVLAATPATGLPGAAHAAAGVATEGADSILGTPGPDLLQGLAGNDSIRGLEGDDNLNGNAGDDSVGGGPGNDVVHGGPGKDRLNGGQGDDTLAGDRDNDTVAGGLGADRFLFDLKSGSDVITDFDSAGGDRIELQANIDYTVVDAPEGFTIKLKDGGSLRLQGVRFAQLGTWLAGPPVAVPAPPPTLTVVPNPPKPPQRVLLAAIVLLAIAFVGLLGVGLVQLVRGPRR